MAITAPALPARLPVTRLDAPLAVVWAMLAVAQVLTLARNGQAVDAALIGWMGGVLTPFVWSAARRALALHRKGSPRS